MLPRPIRRHSRMTCLTHVEVRHGLRWQPGTAVNMCYSGLLVEADSPPPVSARVAIRIGGPDGTPVRLCGTVSRHVGQRGFGIRLDQTY